MQKNITLSTKPIGIFDSGLGGLTILKTLSQLLPKENLVYFGDTVNVPYGAKSQKAVTKFSLAIAHFLQDQGVKLIIVACNTASALALPELQKQISVPVIGVIEPGAEAAARQTRNKRVAVIATEATVNSLSYPKHLAKLDNKIKVIQKPCPLFVPLIEEGWIHKQAGQQIVKDYLQSIAKSKADTVILGCTHYPVIKKIIAGELGTGVQLVDSADILATTVKQLLTEQQLHNPKGKGTLKIYASDAPERFKKLAKHILGKELKQVSLKKLN